MDPRGTELGPFAIKGLIGTGAFASVYQAEDSRSGEDVAIKILADNHSLDPELRARFIDEASALATIASPSVLAIHDICETPDARPYLVLQFADRGGIVARRRGLVANGWAPQVDDVRSIVDMLASSLGAVHAAGFVHRDVTPSNILIRSEPTQDPHGRTPAASSSFLQPDERLILSDFGLVKDLEASSGLTKGAGTAGFASPEQQLPLGTVDSRADVFGASAVVLWMITGEGAHADLDPAPVKADWPTLWRVLRRGLSSDAGDRQPDISAWHEETIRSLEDAAATPPSRRRILIGVAALTAAAATAAAAVVFFADPDAQPGRADTVTSATSSSTTAEAQAPAFAPIPPRVSRIPAGNDARLVVAWGGNPVPADIVESEIQVAIDDGEWVAGARPRQASAGGWEIWSTQQSDGSSLPVVWESTYAVRVRWVFLDGSFSEWSESPVLAADTPPAPEAPTGVVAPPTNEALVFETNGDGVVLALGYGVGSPDSIHVVATEVALRVDDGDWFIEPEVETIVAAALQIWSLGPPDARQQISHDKNYQSRIRWKLTDGTFTDWSDVLSLEAGSPIQ